ncbi:MAG: MlaD family protein [Verrucomicrobia bacterium]|jgi:phospholipid/cholesterol/gamma-HCH transport system substrate-binding protein|nr:MlaD family protein [Verrucomicrobiota bacterium]
MSKSRLELRVGVFVAAGLVLLAVMMIQFSKGKSFFRGTYTVTINTANVGGLQKGASVLLAGVPVGNVSRIDLGPQGTNVCISVEILDEYVIHGDAQFVIEQSGFLGDQYVAIIPQANLVPPLKPGDEVFCPTPFNLQAVARDAAGFLQRIDQTARDLNAAIVEVRRVFLNEQTLSNLADTASSLRETSSEARVTVRNVNQVVEANRDSIASAISNLVQFSDGLNVFADSANALINTNTPPINQSIQDIRESTDSLKRLLKKTESGDNLAAALLSDEELANEVTQIAHNLSITTSNLNERGLWGILWKKKSPPPPTTPEPVEPLRSPRDPFR